MTIKEAKKRIIEILVESLDVENEVTEKTFIIDELGLSSMEIIVLVEELESEFGIEIPVSTISLVETVDELCNVVIEILKN